MKLNSFLKEHKLSIKHFETTEGEDMYVLIQNSDGAELSPHYCMKDAIPHWIKNHVDDLFHMLYNEDT